MEVKVFGAECSFVELGDLVQLPCQILMCLQDLWEDTCGQFPKAQKVVQVEIKSRIPKSGYYYAGVEIVIDVGFLFSSFQSD